MFDLYIYTIYTIYTYDLAASTWHLKQLINETHRLIGTIYAPMSQYVSIQLIRNLIRKLCWRQWRSVASAWQRVRSNSSLASCRGRNYAESDMYRKYSKDFESETRVDAQNSKLTRLRKNFKIAFKIYQICLNDLSEDVQGCPSSQTLCADWWLGWDEELSLDRRDLAPHEPHDTDTT
jgi:hypothetical protein